MAVSSRIRRVAALLTSVAGALSPRPAAAIPTTLFQAPSPEVQELGTLRIAYASWFFPGSARTAAHPTVLGLTGGVLPFDRVRLELGFDAVLPTRDPLVLNAKLGSPEGALFRGSPAWAIGIFGAGVTAGTALDVGYVELGKRTPLGTLSAGGYLGSERLLRTTDGSPARAGFLGGIVFPPIAVGRPWLDRVEIRWDVVTGRNLLGETGVGVALFLTPFASIVTGPVYYFEKFLQPGAAPFLWSVQLIVDVALVRRERAAASSR